jgi:hypothetical protein
MGRFFREFGEAHETAPSMTILLLGIVMFGGMAWLVASVLNGSPTDSILQFIASVQQMLQR